MKDKWMQRAATYDRNAQGLTQELEAICPLAASTRELQRRAETAEAALRGGQQRYLTLVENLETPEAQRQCLEEDISILKASNASLLSQVQPITAREF